MSAEEFAEEPIAEDVGVGDDADLMVEHEHEVRP